MSKTRVLILLVLLLALALNLVIPRPRPPEIVLHAELVPVFGVHIPNTIIAAWLTMLVLIGISYLATRNMQEVPGTLQNAVEWALESLYNFASGIAGEKTRVLFPVVATIFLFILVSNWMGMLPGFGSVGLVEVKEGKEVFLPFLRSANTDLNTTIAVAIFAVLSIQAFGIRFLGFSTYMSRFLNFKKLLGRGNPIEGIVDVFIGLLELVDQFTKILSFSFRLFGNIFAGEVLLTVIAFLLPLVGPMPFMGLELFVGFIQALIFALLTLIFTSMAISQHGQEQGAAHKKGQA